MEKRDLQVVIAVVLAGIVGFALAALLMNDDDTEPVVEPAATTVQTAPGTTTVTATTETAPPATETTTTPDRVPGAAEPPTVASCLELWNRDNNGTPQSFLADVQNRQAVRVNVAASTQVPPKCLVTVIANDGTAYRFTEGAGQAFPYAPQPARLRLADLTAEQRETDALAEPGGKLTAR